MAWDVTTVVSAIGTGLGVAASTYFGHRELRKRRAPAARPADDDATGSADDGRRDGRLDAIDRRLDSHERIHVELRAADVATARAVQADVTDLGRYVEGRLAQVGQNAAVALAASRDHTGPGDVDRDAGDGNDIARGHPPHR